jgi:hypothetical protein
MQKNGIVPIALQKQCKSFLRRQGAKIDDKPLIM